MHKNLKVIYHYLLPKQFLTWLAGHLANSKISWLKNYLIQDFLKRFAVNMSEALESNPFAYTCFNDFFTRRLKPSARPIAKASYVFPADGAIAEAGKITQDRLLQAKGIDYRLQDLLATNETTFINGNFMTIYLAPKDYHRVHLPIDATLIEQVYIPGRLFSVQPFTTANIPNVFSQNERLVLNFSSQNGPFTMVLVGATIVGCMGTSWQGDLKRQSNIQRIPQNIAFKQGDEIGYFKLGSTVILLWPKTTQLEWCQDWEHGMTTIMGQAITN
jgi:phosphatidylserine decarboxylase